jgi:hypothetical protein
MILALDGHCLWEMGRLELVEVLKLSVELPIPVYRLAAMAACIYT